MLDFLPPLLKRLYQSFRVPYARGTRVRETPEPDPEIAVSMRERSFRVEIIQDAFCERRPRPERLFRKPSGHRDLYSWCDLEASRYPTTRHRCAHCTDASDLYRRANAGDWQAECRLHRLATRASMRLLAERRAWAETSRRQRAARTPEPGPPPAIWVMLGWKRWRDRKREYPPATERWFIVERREAEAKLVRAHTRTLQRMSQRRRARARDRELAREREVVGRKSAERAFRHPLADDAPLPGEKVTDATDSPSSRGAQRRGDPGQRGKRLSRGPGSPRRQSAARDDGVRADGLPEPTADAAPPQEALAPVALAVEPTDAPARGRNDGVSEPTTDAPARDRNDGVPEPTIDPPACGRDDGAHTAGPSAPPSEAAPADAPETAPAIAPTPEPAPAPVRIALIPYPPGGKTSIRIGAGRLTIPPPRASRTGGAPTQAHPTPDGSAADETAPVHPPVGRPADTVPRSKPPDRLRDGDLAPLVPITQ